MGTPKALLPWARGTMLSHAVDRLRAAGLEPWCAGPPDWALAAACPHLEDDPPLAGPLGAIAAALRQGDAFVLAVDMPLLTPEEIVRLIEVGEAAQFAAVPIAAGGPQPLAAFWPGYLLSYLRQYLDSGGRSVLSFLAEAPHIRLQEPDLVRLGVDPGHLRGCNTPEEYLALTQGGGGEVP